MRGVIGNNDQRAIGQPNLLAQGFACRGIGVVFKGRDAPRKDTEHAAPKLGPPPRCSAQTRNLTHAGTPFVVARDFTLNKSLHNGEDLASNLNGGQTEHQSETPMTYRETVTVHDAMGLHARPAGQIVKLVRDSGLEVHIANQAGQLVSGLSALRMMAMKVRSGDAIEIQVETDDNQVAAALVAQIQEFVKG